MATISNTIGRLAAQVDALQKEIARLASLPEDNYESGAVVRFTHTFGATFDSDGRSYDYAAIKAIGKWYPTGGAGSATGTPRKSMTWEDLLGFADDGSLQIASCFRPVR